jgi:flavin reductase (DIM6/NTAB) family NADH-FMN oxidoreductase RutF
MPSNEELIGPFPEGADPKEYDRLRRRVLWKMPTGLYLLGSRDGERRNLMACNLLTQVSTDPKLIGIAVEKEAFTLELIVAGRCFALALLAREDRALVRKFAKPAEHDAIAHTLEGVAYLDAKTTGAPIPAVALAYLDCTLERVVAFGSHCFVVGEVVDAGFLGDEDQEVLRMEDTRMSYGG